MKKVIVLSLILTLSGISIFAQPADITPQKIAEKQTDMLKKELSLNEKQHKKVYKLYLKRAQKMESEFSSMGTPPPNQMRGEREHMGGTPPDGMRPDRQPGMQRQHPEGMQPRGQEGRMPPKMNYEESQEDIAKRDKKMKKILDTDQYDKWQKLEKDMLTKGHRNRNNHRPAGAPKQ